MWLRVLSCGWIWLILEKRSEILDKNFISNIRFFFLPSEIQKDVQKVTSFVLSYSNSALYIWLCFWTHTRTVSPPCSFDTLVINVVQFHICRFPSFFLHPAPLQRCVPVFPITVISKMSIWFTGHRLDQMETSEVASDALSNSFTPWLVLSLINK